MLESRQNQLIIQKKKILNCQEKFLKISINKLKIYKTRILLGAQLMSYQV